MVESFQHEETLICDYFLYKGIANESKKLYGAQFHPEVGLTENGKVILKNFLYDIAGCSGTFTVQNRELECIREIRERVGTSKVLVSSLHWKVYKLMSIMLESELASSTAARQFWAAVCLVACAVSECLSVSIHTLIQTVFLGNGLS